VGEGEATELLLDAAALELDDMFSFDVQRAVGMPPVVEPVVLEASRLLEFAEIPSIVVPALAAQGTRVAAA
jgi:hypothetical protein